MHGRTSGRFHRRRAHSPGGPWARRGRPPPFYHRFEMEANLPTKISPSEAFAGQLLFHSYHFPPIGGSGAQRPLRMVRCLASLGYRPVVVTGGGATEDRWAPEDRTLVADIPPGLDVRRLEAASEPSGSSRWRGRAERWLFLRPRWSDWWIESSVELGIRASEDVDLIYVWMQPYDSAEAGAALSRRLGKPWVADLGDPWALDEMMVYPTGMHRRRDLARMGSLLGTASAIVMSTPEAARRLLAAFPRLVDRPVVVIPNGFAAEDFTGGRPERRDGPFRIVHTGYLHTELGLQQRRSQPLRRALGGTIRGLDILTRSHVYLVEAVNRLLESDTSLAGMLELHLAGVMTDADREVARRCSATELHGYVTHAESVELMRSADLLFLPMQNLPPGVRATIVPGKTYEYLASGTPILGAVPDGDARDILEQAGNSILVRPDDVAGMSAAIGSELEQLRAGIPSRLPDPAFVGRFEYGRLAADLAAVLDAVRGSTVRPLTAG
jgi:glycosyltransferase involved in cell wall biosynthesis